MYAIIKDRGRQYRVTTGSTILIDKRPDAAGEIEFDQVLVLGHEGDGDAKICAPTVDGAKVTATILGEVRGKKIKIFKYKPRKKTTRQRQGHRQRYTRVRIESIEGA